MLLNLIFVIQVLLNVGLINCVTGVIYVCIRFRNWFKNWNKCLMHISSTAVPKDVGEEKERIAEIHLYKHRRKEKYKCSPDKQDVH